MTLLDKRYTVCVMASLLLITLIALTAQASAAAPAMAWNETYRINKGMLGQSMISTGDGYLLAGTFTYGTSADFFLIKADFDGNEVWNRTYDLNWTDFRPLLQLSMIAVNDGYVVTGTQQSEVSDFTAAYIAKVDRNGNLIWSNISRIVSGGNSVMPVSGGYVMAGYSGGHAFVGMFESGFLIKTDSGGNEIWNRTYRAPGADDIIKAARALNNSFLSLEQIPDGRFEKALVSGDGYILAGEANGSAWLVKADPDGNETWNRTYGDGRIDAIVNASDGYVFLNNRNLVKIDVNGNVIWDGDLSKYLAGSWIESLAATSDGYILAGETNKTNDGTYQIYLMKTDRNGNPIWNTTYAMAGNNFASSLIVDQGAYVLGGTSKFNASDYWDTPWLLKTRVDDAGTMPATPAASLMITALAISVAAIALKSRK